MKKTIVMALCLIGAAATASARFKIHSDGKISINTTETPVSPISINTAGNSTAYMSYQGPKRFLYAATAGATSGSSFILMPSQTVDCAMALTALSYPFNAQNAHAFGVGAFMRSEGAPHGIGVLGHVNSNISGAGVVGCPTTTVPSYTLFDHNYAGLFFGDVKVTSNLKVDGGIQGTLVNPSATPNNSTLLQEMVQNRGGSTSSLLANLDAFAYKNEVRAEDFEAKLTEIKVDDSLTVTMASADENNYIGRQRAENTHYALDADQLEKAFPGLVYQMADGTKQINYVEMVPLLVQCINELNARLSAMDGGDVGAGPVPARKARTAETSIDGTTAKAQAVLYQNTPNPFTAQTEIRFSLPADAPQAYIYIFDMTGKMQKQIPVDASQQSITINGYELQAGIYLYSLVVGGQEIDTKRMILSK